MGACIYCFYTGSPNPNEKAEASVVSASDIRR